jgi:hypothetical protein
MEIAALLYNFSFKKRIIVSNPSVINLMTNSKATKNGIS